jgi:hypothetical protein
VLKLAPFRTTNEVTVAMKKPPNERQLTIEARLRHNASKCSIAFRSTTNLIRNFHPPQPFARATVCASFSARLQRTPSWCYTAGASIKSLIYDHRRQRKDPGVSGGVITMLPKLPNADDEYTPEQRRLIDARLDVAEKGKTYGPFTAAEATRFLKAELKSRSKTLKKTR